MDSYYSRAESDTTKLLRVQLEVANAQNERLKGENEMLRNNMSRKSDEQKLTSNTSVENRLRAFAMEEERDKMYENLERLKRQYSKLHAAYLEKVTRCKVLEEVFAKQKMLPGLVKKSTMEEARHAPSQSTISASEQCQFQEEKRSSSLKIASLQKQLNEAFDIIDELEFELESVDYLEIENERLKNELSHLKKDRLQQPQQSTNDVRSNGRHSNRSTTCSSGCDECDGVDGLPNLESIERSVLTNSLSDTVQTESHLLRRELLRSRLQNTRPQRASGITYPTTNPTKSE